MDDPELQAEMSRITGGGKSNPATDAITNFDAAAWLAGKSAGSGTSTPRGETGVKR